MPRKNPNLIDTLKKQLGNFLDFLNESKMTTVYFKEAGYQRAGSSNE